MNIENPFKSFNGCSCNDDWDIIKIEFCEFCHPENVKKRSDADKIIQEHRRKLKITKRKDKRFRYEKKRNEKCKKNKMKQLVKYVNKAVYEDKDKYELVAGLSANFKADDLFCLKLFIVETNVNNLINLLNSRRLYHIRIEKVLEINESFHNSKKKFTLLISVMTQFTN